MKPKECSSLCLEDCSHTLIPKPDQLQFNCQTPAQILLSQKKSFKVIVFVTLLICACFFFFKLPTILLWFTPFTDIILLYLPLENSEVRATMSSLIILTTGT